MQTAERETELIILVGLGKCFLQLNDEVKAKRYFDKSKTIISKLGEKKSEETHYGLIGGAYRETARKKEAIGFFKKAMKLADSNKRKLKCRIKKAEDYLVKERVNLDI